MVGLVRGFKGLKIPSSFTVSSNTQSIQIDHPYQILWTLLPEDSTNTDIFWDSSDESIATVSEGGLITPVSVGECTITGHTASNWLVQTIAVTTYVVHTTGVELNMNTMALEPGTPQQLIATVLPELTNYPEVTWSSSDDSIATVDSNGLVTYVSAGNCTITCTTVDGGFTDTCDVTAIIPVSSVSLNASSATIIRGGTYQLTATVNPSDATIKTVTWKSSNTNIATVSSTGLVTYVAAGSCTITVTTDEGGKTATCSISCQNINQCWGYTGNVQSRTVPATGNYCIETWGAQGGGSYGGNAGAKGAYAAGKVTLTTGRVLCIYVGGQGGCSSSIGCHSGISGGWNGGGSGGGTYYSGGCSSVGGGGGGTDVRFNGNTLCNRFIVAGGGAGGGTQICSSTYYYQCGGGGAASGCGSRPGTQTSAGRSGGFGQGANASVNTNRRSTTPGGGGGRYGGGGACVNDNSGSSSALVYASGGSSYTYTSSTCGNHPNKGCLGSLPLMTDAVCCGCGSSFPTASGGTETGHSGNGCVKIRIV